MQRLTRSARPDVVNDTTGKHQFTENRDGGVEIHDIPVPWVSMALGASLFVFFCLVAGGIVAALALWVG